MKLIKPIKEVTENLGEIFGMVVWLLMPGEKLTENELNELSTEYSMSFTGLQRTFLKKPCGKATYIAKLNGHPIFRTFFPEELGVRWFLL